MKKVDTTIIKPGDVKGHNCYHHSPEERDKALNEMDQKIREKMRKSEDDQATAAGTSRPTIYDK